MSGIKGVIFDMDGVLLDSMPIYRTLDINYLKSFGLTPKPGLRDVLRLSGDIEVARHYQTEYGVRKSVAEIDAGRKRLLEEFYLYSARLKGGVIAVLEKLHVKGIKMCVATATERRLTEPALDRCGVSKYFDRILTCGEEETSKRNPDIFLRAAAFIGTEVCDTLVVEDALHAIKSAKSAGFRVAAVYDLSSDDQKDEIKALSDYYLESVDEMLNMI